MPTVTLRPASTVRRVSPGGAGSTVIFGGLGDDVQDAWRVLQDDTDASYHYASEAALAALTAPAVWQVAFNDMPPLPAGARVDYVSGRQRIAMANAAANQRLACWFLDQVNGDVMWAQDFQTTRDGVHRTVVGRQATKDGYGRDWSIAELNRLSAGMQFYVYPGGLAGDAWLYETYLDVHYKRQGAVEISAPADGGTVFTARPQIGWTPTAPDNAANPQYSYLVRVFTAAQVAAPGFNSFTSPAVWSSGEVVNGSTREVTIGVDLSNGAYVAFVSVAQPWAGTAGRWWSTDSAAFNVITAVPDTPSVTATGEDVDARIRVRVRDIDPAAEEVIVEVDDGSGWVPVRGAEMAPVTGEIMTFYDYERPPWRVARYRALVVDTDDDVRAVSAPSVEAPAMWRSDACWLKDPLDPTKNRIVEISEFAFKERRPQTRMDLLGNQVPAIIHDGTKGHEGNVAMWVKDEGSFEALKAMVRDTSVMLLQRNIGDQFFIARGETVDFTQLRAAPMNDEQYSIRHAHSLSFSWSEAAAP